MRAFALLTLGLVTTGCAGAGATAGTAPVASAPAVAASSGATAAAVRTAKAAAPSTRLRITGPATIGEFAFVQQSDWPDPAYGDMLRYKHPSGLQADVFVYPGPDLDRECDVECAKRIMHDEATSLANQMRAQTDMSNYRTVSAQDLVPTDGVRWRTGHHMHGKVTYASRAHEQHTDYWIVFFPGYRVKVRSTFDDSPEAEAALARFLERVAPVFSAEGAVVKP